MVHFEFILTYKNGSKLKSTTSGPFCHFHVKAYGNMSSHGRPRSCTGRGAQVCVAAGVWGSGRAPLVPSRSVVEAEAGNGTVALRRETASLPLLWKDGYFDLSSASVSQTSAMREQSRAARGAAGDVASSGFRCCCDLAHARQVPSLDTGPTTPACSLGHHKWPRDLSWSFGHKELGPYGHGYGRAVLVTSSRPGHIVHT